MGELTPEQRARIGSSHGLLVEDVVGTPRGDIRPGDIVLAVTTKGVTTEVKSVEQMNKALSGIDKGSVLTLHIRRGDSSVFSTVRVE